MRKLFLMTFLSVTCSVSAQIRPLSPIFGTQLCNFRQDVTHEYRAAIYEFSVRLYKSAAVRSNLNFVLSPLSIWIMIAAIAEGTDVASQQRLFQFLNLPNGSCKRQAYYQLATTRVFSSNDVDIKSTRVLLLDDRSTVNPSWYDLVLKSSLLDVVTAPIRSNPVATANEIKRIMSARLPGLNLNGNSVLLDTMDYNGLWTTAFADAVIERAPFYNHRGEPIGAVDIMKVRKQARMGYIKRIHAKVLELPVGSDERYRMLFCVIIGNGNLGSVAASVDTDLVFEMVASLRESYVQLDIAVPRVVITSEIDVRLILEELGVNNIWTDPGVTRSISRPPPLPSSFVQRSTVVLNSTGLVSPVYDLPCLYCNTRTGLEPVLGTDFIADRPFLFGLFDAETFTPIMGAAYSKPTY